MFNVLATMHHAHGFSRQRKKSGKINPPPPIESDRTDFFKASIKEVLEKYVFHIKWQKICTKLTLNSLEFKELNNIQNFTKEKPFLLEDASKQMIFQQIQLLIDHIHICS